MPLPADAVPAIRECASRRAAPSAAGMDLRADAPAALATWLAWHDFPDPHSRGIDGVTPLMLAALHGEDGMVRALLAGGARIDALDDEGNSALWYACIGGAPASILRLIEAGIEIDHANDSDVTCLMQAAASGRVEVMQLLLSHGARENLYAPDGRNALDMAADRGFELLRAARRLTSGKPGRPGTPDLQIADPGRVATAANTIEGKAA